MSEKTFDITPYLTSNETFPYPDWPRVSEAITTGFSESEHHATWTDAARQWLTEASEYLTGYHVRETKHVLLLLPAESDTAAVLPSEAEHSRSLILDLLPGVTRFESPGKQVVLVMPDLDGYYSYISAFYPEHGVFGGSGGMFMRSPGYPHIVLYMSSTGHHLVPSLAHEMTHEALSHLNLPAWLEEGATQCIEHASIPGGGFGLTAEKVNQHKRYWRRHGLGAFWWGRGYHRPGRVQGLCYDLSNVFFHLLSEEYRPAWFGLFGSGRREKLLLFFQEADDDDAGAAAAEKHLGMSLANLAEKFLGPGDWAPRSEDREQIGANKPESEDEIEKRGEA